MIQAFQIASSGLKRWLKPARNEAYKRWIKRFPCLACGSTYMVDPAHTGPHGFGSRSSDYSCIPLCRKCHPEFDAAPRQFAFHRGIAGDQQSSGANAKHFSGKTLNQSSEGLRGKRGNHDHMTK